MEVKTLVYFGGRTDGTLIVKQMPANSPFRELKYYKGMKLELGIDIPPKVADMIVNGYKSLFRIETIVLDDQQSFEREFSHVLQRYLMLDPQLIVESVEKVMTAEFGPPADDDGSQTQEVQADAEKPVDELSAEKSVAAKVSNRPRRSK